MNYSGKLRNKLPSSDSASMWKGLKYITNYKTPSPSTQNQQLADDFNEFYCRFGNTPHTRPEHLSTQPLTPPATHFSPTPALKMSEDDVRQVFRENKRRKAPGPDSGSIFKKSPLMLQMLPYHPRPKETPNYWTQWLQTCGSNIYGH